MFRNKFIKYFLLLINISAITTISGQDIHYSNNYENLFNNNPSSITEIKNATIYLNYRNQWPGSTDFVNYSGAFFSTFKNLKSTFGIQVLRDDQGNGLINTTNFALLYGYRTKVYKDIIFSSGISGSYNLYSINTNQLIFEDNSVPLIIENSETHFFDFKAGFEFSFYNQSWLGFSCSHLTAPQINSETGLYRKYIINYHGNYSLVNRYNFRKIYIEPILLTSLQKDASELIYGGRITIEGLQGGLFLRNDYQMNFDSFIILLGISLKNIIVNYAYDINLSGSQSRFNKLASHEVTFLCNFEYNNRRSKKGAIKCPKF